MPKPTFVLSNAFLTSCNTIRHHPNGEEFVKSLNMSHQNNLTSLCMNKIDDPAKLTDQQRKDFERLVFVQIMNKDKRVCIGTYEHKPTDDDAKIVEQKAKSIDDFQDFFPSFLSDPSLMPSSEGVNSDLIQLNPQLEKFAADYHHQGGYIDDAESIFKAFLITYQRANPDANEAMLTLDRNSESCKYAYFNIIDASTLDYTQVSVINGFNDGNGDNIPCKFSIELKSTLSFEPDLEHPGTLKPQISLENYSLRFETEEDKKTFLALFKMPQTFLERVIAFIKSLFKKETLTKGIADSFTTADYEKSLFNFTNALKENKTLGLSQEYLHAQALHQHFINDPSKKYRDAQLLPAWPKSIHQEPSVWAKIFNIFTAGLFKTHAEHKIVISNTTQKDQAQSSYRATKEVGAEALEAPQERVFIGAKTYQKTQGSPAESLENGKKLLKP